MVTILHALVVVWEPVNHGVDHFELCLGSRRGEGVAARLMGVGDATEVMDVKKVGMCTNTHTDRWTRSVTREHTGKDTGQRRAARKIHVPPCLHSRVFQFFVLGFRPKICEPTRRVMRMVVRPTHW